MSINRYKYLQKPLDDSALPTLLQYVHRWSPAHTSKFATAVGLLLAQGLANASCLQGLTKDHLVKNGTPFFMLIIHHLLILQPVVDVSINVMTQVFRSYLAELSMDHLSPALKKGGIKDLLAFFPPNKREGKYLEEHFRKEGLPQVAEWWTKKQYAALKASLIKELHEMIERDDSIEQVVSWNFSFCRMCLYQCRSSRLSNLARRSLLSLKMN